MTLICKICKKEVDYKTLGGVCSKECEQKDKEQLARTFEGVIYWSIANESQKLGLHDYKLVKQATLKALEDLSFNW